MDAPQALLEFFTDYGYYFLFLVTALENIPVVGAFLPGEVTVVAAAFLAAQGRLDLAAVVIVATGGAFLGSNISYGLGRWGGRALVESLARRFRVDGDRLEAADHYFSSRGPLAVFVGRYLSGVKALVPALAGAHRMRWSTFMAYAALGIISWTILAALLGFHFGRNWDALLGVLRLVGWLIPAVIVVMAFVWWFVRRNK